MAVTSAFALSSIVQRRMIIRTKYLALGWIPMTCLYMVIRTSPSGEPYHFIAVTLPYIVGLCVAAWLPQGIPPTMAHVAAMVMGIMAATDGNFAFREWRADYPPHERVLRTLVPGSFAVANMLLALDLLLTRARRWWNGLQLVLTTCCTIRLVAAVMLRELGATPNSYPPGNLAFTVSMWYSVMCIAVATVGFSLPCRQYLSDLTGGSRVVWWPRSPTLTLTFTLTSHLSPSALSLQLRRPHLSPLTLHRLPLPDPHSHPHPRCSRSPTSATRASSGPSSHTLATRARAPGTGSRRMAGLEGGTTGRGVAMDAGVTSARITAPVAGRTAVPAAVAAASRLMVSASRHWSVAGAVAVRAAEATAALKAARAGSWVRTMLRTSRSGDGIISGFSLCTLRTWSLTWQACGPGRRPLPWPLRKANTVGSASCGLPPVRSCASVAGMPLRLASCTAISLYCW